MWEDDASSCEWWLPLCYVGEGLAPHALVGLWYCFRLWKLDIIRYSVGTGVPDGPQMVALVFLDDVEDQEGDDAHREGEMSAFRANGDVCPPT